MFRWNRNLCNKTSSKNCQITSPGSLKNVCSNSTRSMSKLSPSTTKRATLFSQKSTILKLITSVKHKFLRLWAKLLQNQGNLFFFYGERSVISRSVKTTSSRVSSRTYVSKLEKELVAEKGAREQLQKEIEEIKRVNSEISSKLGIKMGTTKHWFNLLIKC